MWESCWKEYEEYFKRRWAGIIAGVFQGEYEQGLNRRWAGIIAGVFQGEYEQGLNRRWAGIIVCVFQGEYEHWKGLEQKMGWHNLWVFQGGVV